MPPGFPRMTTGPARLPNSTHDRIGCSWGPPYLELGLDAWGLLCAPWRSPARAARDFSGSKGEPVTAGDRHQLELNDSAPSLSSGGVGFGRRPSFVLAELQPRHTSGGAVVLVFDAGSGRSQHHFPKLGAPAHGPRRGFNLPRRAGRERLDSRPALATAIRLREDCDDQPGRIELL